MIDTVKYRCMLLAVSSKMASLHKRPRSQYFHVAYTGPDGRRRLVSTGCKDKDEAWKFALKMQDSAREARSGTFTEAQARKLLNECLVSSTGGELKVYTCKEWLDEWLSGKGGATEETTHTKYSGDIDSFVDSLGRRAHLNIAAMRPTDVRQWRDQRRKKGLSVTTCNLAVKVLKSAFERALKLGYIPVNPCAAVDPLKDDASATRDVFTPEQISKLMEAAGSDSDWAGAILFGYYTGLRLRDVANLTWGMIDAKAHVLHAPTKKTGITVDVPLHQELRDWLKTRPTGIGKAPLFPNLRGKSGSGKSGLSCQFKRIMEAAKIHGRTLRKAKGEGRKQSSLSFHSLRHSFVSALANAGVAADVRQKLAGHSDAKSHARYSHHELDTMRAAVELLPALSAL